MRIYWTVNSVPELSGLPVEEKARLWRVCWRKSYCNWWPWIAFVSLGIIAALASYFVAKRFPDNQLVICAMPLIGCGVASVVFGQILMYGARKHLRIDMDAMTPKGN